MKPGSIAILAVGVVLAVAAVLLFRTRQPTELRPMSVLPKSYRVAGTTKQPPRPSAGKVSERVRRRLRLLQNGRSRSDSLQPGSLPRKASSGMEEPKLPPARRRRVTPRTQEELDAEDEADLAHLSETFLNDPDPDEREGAVFFLSAIDAPETVNVLLQGLNDSSVEVRLAVVEALGDFDEQIRPQYLTPALEDDNAEVRFEAVSVLGDLETPEALASVRGMLNDPDEDVRSLAEGIVELSE